ncbi:MAG: DUF3995 domain-containing protein [Bacteroidota bacterium]
MNNIGLFNTIIFFLLSMLHFYWVLGGKWALKDAVPYNEKGEKVLNPGKFDTLIVGIGLLLFAVFYLASSDLLEFALPAWLMKYGGWSISIIFLLRALGDFKYVGFSKKIKSTDFAKKDTQIYSPLCLLLGIVGVLVQLF